MDSIYTPPVRTVHVVGHMSMPVLNILMSTFRALDDGCRQQVLVVADDSILRESRPRLPTWVDVIAVPDQSTSMGLFRALFGALQRLADTESVDELHLHGMMPAMAATHVYRGRNIRPASVTLNPHGSRLLGWLGMPKALIWRLMRDCFGNVVVHSTASSCPSEPGQASADGVIHPVFFECDTARSDRPFVVAGSHHLLQTAMDEFARLAVLLGDERLGIDFGWLGPVHDEAREKFRAAGIRPLCEDELDERARAEELCRAWIFVDLSLRRDFPIRLAEAMAAGLPSVALMGKIECPLIEHGVTGYQCKDVVELIAKTAELIDDPLTRALMGDAARERARSRFSEAAFIGHLWLDAILSAPGAGLTSISVGKP